MIKGIIFDLGGVILNNFDHSFYRKAELKYGIPENSLAKACVRLWPPLEKNHISNGEFWKRVAADQRLDQKLARPLAALWISYYHRYSKLNTPILTFAKKLRREYRVGVLSNTQREHTIFNKKRKLFQNFDFSILSDKVGTRKPEKRIYAIAVKKMRFRPKEIVFIDDEIKWIRAAKKIGIKTIHFKDLVTLKKDLTRISVNIK